MSTPITMKVTLGALSGLISYCNNKKMTLTKIKCHVDNIAFCELRGVDCFAHAYTLALAADLSRSFAAMADAIQAIINEIERAIDAAHDEALNINALRDGVDVYRETVCKAFRAFWYKSDEQSLMTANRVWCQMRDEASAMNDGIDKALAVIDAMMPEPGAEEAARGVLIRADYNECDYLADAAMALWHRSQPCAAAEHNAHYYQLLIAKRQRKGQVAMTECHLAYQYILNDAIAGDMVKSCDVYRMEILFRDGSWLQLVETMTTDITPHGFYVKTQNKLA